jgi:hypothetical protein
LDSSYTDNKPEERRDYGKEEITGKKRPEEERPYKS